MVSQAALVGERSCLSDSGPCRRRSVNLKNLFILSDVREFWPLGTEFISRLESGSFYPGHLVAMIQNPDIHSIQLADLPALARPIPPSLLTSFQNLLLPDSFCSSRTFCSSQIYLLPFLPLLRFCFSCSRLSCCVLDTRGDYGGPRLP